MTDIIYIAAVGVVCFLAGFLINRFIISERERKNLSSKTVLAKRIVEKAKKDGEKILKDADTRASEVMRKKKLQFEKSDKDKRRDLLHAEQKVQKNQELVNKKLQDVQEREADINRRQKSLDSLEDSIGERHGEIDTIKTEMKKRLEELSGMSAEEVRSEMIKNIEEEARKESSLMVREIEDEAEAGAKETATKIIALAVQRYAGKYTAENTSSTVTLPDPNIKGKIIGREGRNIRALEIRTGVDFVMDESPDTVVLTSLNSLRREIAVIALKRLLDDGRVHPARIEEIVSEVEEEINKDIKKAGEGAVFELGIHDMDPELVRHVGMLKYRRSYAQNMLNHSLEVAFICGMLAAEIGYDQNLAKRAALLHDVGKAVDHEVEGTHMEIGAELARKYKENPLVVNAVAKSHDSRIDDVLSIIVQAADAISAARPGARKESYEKYIKRVEEIEEIGGSFNGVSKCFAVQAGRELRVIVENSSVDDKESAVLSKDIAKKIEKEVNYPGKIKITVIRETRAVAYAS